MLTTPPIVEETSHCPSVSSNQSKNLPLASQLPTASTTTSIDKTLTSPTPDGSKPSTSPWPFPKDREPNLNATPIAYKATSSEPGLGSPHSPALYSQYDAEFQDHWIGPIELDDFLDFLPKAKVRMPRAPRHLIGHLRNDAYSKQKLNLILVRPAILLSFSQLLTTQPARAVRAIHW